LTWERRTSLPSNPRSHRAQRHNKRETRHKHLLDSPEVFVPVNARGGYLPGWYFDAQWNRTSVRALRGESSTGLAVRAARALTEDSPHSFFV